MMNRPYVLDMRKITHKGFFLVTKLDETDGFHMKLSLSIKVKVTRKKEQEEQSHGNAD
ncbi:MAG: hypothetical protein PUB10_04335 [Clostridiales bacterium]|nr:hypothetical protein [Clostridiales bacterium]